MAIGYTDTYIIITYSTLQRPFSEVYGMRATYLTAGAKADNDTVANPAALTAEA